MTYPIPAVALDDRLAFIGTSGSGKTYNASTGVERLMASGARVVIVDPLDVWWGLRLRADGEAGSKFKPVIFGGAHGDLPLTEHSGALIGETVAKMRESCIVSLGGFPTKAAERRFMLAFLTALYRHAPGEPLHLVCDEADLWAPQVILDKDGDAQKLKGQMEQIVRRGRVKGFIPWLITQRPAVLSKDVLSQADGLIAFKLTSSQDRDAIGAWIEGQADRAQGREILASLPTMQQGQGVVWVPGRGILESAAFPAKVTFDSSRTPKRGEVLRTASLKPLDLGALKERLSAVEADAKANDPKALKAEVARLTRDLAQATSGGVDAAAVRQAEQTGYSRGKVDGYAEGIQDAHGAMKPLLLALPALEKAIGGIRAGEENLSAWLARDPKGPPSGPAPVISPQRQRLIDRKTERQVTAAPAAPAPAPAPTGDGSVTGPQQKLLDALAWWEAFGIATPTSDQLAFVAGYSASSSTWSNLKGALRTAGLIDYPTPGRIALSETGRPLASMPSVEVSQEAFHQQVRAKLTGPQVRLLNPLLESYPVPMASNDLAEVSGYSVTSSTFSNLRGSLRSLGFIDYPTAGMVIAAGWLFPELNG